MAVSHKRKIYQSQLEQTFEQFHEIYPLVFVGIGTKIIFLKFFPAQKEKQQILQTCLPSTYEGSHHTQY